MRALYCYLRGYLVIEICGAAPGWALNKLAEQKIAFWDIVWIDSLTVLIKVFRGKENDVEALARAAMCDCRVMTEKGIFQPIGRLFKRHVLMIWVFAALLSTMVLPCFLFFFEVEGNTTIPDQQILRELKQSGVQFGIFGPKIYPRRVKDHMIEALPRLEWVTVEQHGCRGKVIVRERDEIPETETKKGFANVVAVQSGVITKQSVYTGQAQFQIGDTVTEGDILVSGIVDLERTYLIERANAEVFARTWRKIHACIPSTFIGKTENTGKKKCFWLILGERRIKIFGNSGISHGSCDKMIDNRTLTLPMGLTLPISLEIETFSFYEGTAQEMDQQTAETKLKEYAAAAVTEQMCAGEILHQSGVFREEKGYFSLDSTLECHEMIAKVIEAKWNNEDFIND